MYVLKRVGGIKAYASEDICKKVWHLTLTLQVWLTHATENVQVQYHHLVLKMQSSSSSNDFCLNPLLHTFLFKLLVNAAQSVYLSFKKILLVLETHTVEKKCI